MNLDCDYEPVECHSETTRMSRGVVKCDDCSRVVPKGARYVVTKYLYDGAWTTLATCPDCEAVLRWFRAKGAECMARGGIREWIDDGLSPHDFRSGGLYADAPRLPMIEAVFVRWAAHYELDPVTLEPKS